MNKINFIFSIISLLIAASSEASNVFRIELCVMPMNEFVPDTSEGFLSRYHYDHVYVRGVAGDFSQGLSFEPRDLKDIFGVAPARIEKRILSRSHNLKCETLFETNNCMECQTLWAQIEEAFDRAAKEDLYDFVANNSTIRTLAILDELGYAVPVTLADRLQKPQEWACEARDELQFYKCVLQ